MILVEYVELLTLTLDGGGCHVAGPSWLLSPTAWAHSTAPTWRVQTERGFLLPLRPFRLHADADAAGRV